MRPLTLLLILVSCAIAAFGWTWGLNQRNAMRLQPGSGNPSAEGSPAGDPGTPDLVRDLEDRVKSLEGQLTAAQRQNKDLLGRLREVENRDAAEPEGIARRVAGIRGEEFKNPVEFLPVANSEINRRISERVATDNPPANARLRERVYHSMGFTRDPFDFVEALTGLTIEQSGVYFDPDENKLYYDKDVPLGSMEARSRVVEALATALVGQHHDLSLLPLHSQTNDDEALAALSLIRGDASLVKIQYTLKDLLGNDAPPGAQPMTQQFYGAPIFMRERRMFPYMFGSHFAEILHQEGDFEAIGNAYGRPPRSTAEIMHPELYLDGIEPERVGMSDAVLEGRAPLASNVAGELNILLLFKTVMTEDLAARAADGWRGDRYLVYDGATPGNADGDHVVWKTRWIAPEEATEFLNAIMKAMLQRYTIPFHKKYLDEAAGAFTVNDPTRVIRIRTDPDKKGVSVINTPSEKFADALEAEFLAE